MKRHSVTAALPILLGCVLWFGASAPAAEIKTAADTRWIEDVGGTAIKDPAGRITGVDLHGSWVSDTDLRRLAQLPNLTNLDLSLTRITDQGMLELKNLAGIVDLNLYYAEYVTDEGLAAIKGWKNLKRLNVHGSKISDTTLEHISGISTLESLNMGSAMVTDIGLERLTSLPNLKELTMGGNKLTDAGLQALRQMPNLTYLDLAGRQGTDANVWAIRMSDKGLDAVLTLKQLRELRFGCTSLGVGIEGARFAEVSATSVTTGWLEKMKALPKLEKLTVQGCDRVNDDSIRALAALPGLRQVDLKGSAVTEKGLAALKAARPEIHVYFGPWIAKAADFRNN
jgi:internalin A